MPDVSQKRSRRRKPTRKKAIDPDSLIYRLVNSKDPLLRKQLARELFEEHAGSVHRFVKRNVWNSRAADELTQQLFLNLLKVKNSSYDGQGDLAYLIGAAKNLIASWVDREARVDVDSDRCDKVPADSSTVDEVLMAESSKLVRGAVDALEYDLREAVVLHYFEGLTYEQIEEKLGISHGTLTGRLHRARNNLRELLDGPDRREKGSDA